MVTGVEMFRKLLDEGQAGDNVGLLLRGVEKHEIERGMVLAKPGVITPHTQFEAEVYVLTKEEGGRHTPFFKGYRPQFYFRTTDVTGSVELPAGVEMVMPGDNIQMTIELITPIAMDEGLRFAIREGGRTVGAGVVTKISEVGDDETTVDCRRDKDHPGVHRVQEPQLLHGQEQAEAPRAGRAAEVLPPVRHAPRAQRVEVVMDRVQVAQPPSRLTGWVDRTRRLPRRRARRDEEGDLADPRRAGQGDADDRRALASCSASRSA